MHVSEPVSPARTIPDQKHPWQEIVRQASQVAPRVGDTRYSADSEVFVFARQMLPHMHLESLFVCRGTERFQVPLHAPASHECPIRHTISPKNH